VKKRSQKCQNILIGFVYRQAYFWLYANQKQGNILSSMGNITNLSLEGLWRSKMKSKWGKIWNTNRRQLTLMAIDPYGNWPLWQLTLMAIDPFKYFVVWISKSELPWITNFQMQQRILFDWKKCYNFFLYTTSLVDLSVSK
jgi:hypothetical protein